MPTWLVTFLTNLLSPIIQSVVTAMKAEWDKVEQAKEDGRINQAEQDANAAKTDAEIIKAAHEEADASHHL